VQDITQQTSTIPTYAAHDRTFWCQFGPRVNLNFKPLTSTKYFLLG